MCKNECSFIFARRSRENDVHRDRPHPDPQRGQLEAQRLYPVQQTVDEYEETWNRMETADRRVRLVVDELLEDLRSLRDEGLTERDAAFPLVLSAGERRSSTANTIYRDPSWRKKDRAGALRMSPQDATALGLSDGDWAEITTPGGTGRALVEVNENMQRGHISLPNGQGLSYPTDNGPVLTGLAPNELTTTTLRDRVAGTPWHKHVPARVKRIS